MLSKPYDHGSIIPLILSYIQGYASACLLQMPKSRPTCHQGDSTPPQMAICTHSTVYICTLKPGCAGWDPAFADMTGA